MAAQRKICTRCKREFGGPDAPDMCQACRQAVRPIDRVTNARHNAIARQMIDMRASIIQAVTEYF